MKKTLMLVLAALLLVSCGGNSQKKSDPNAAGRSAETRKTAEADPQAAAVPDMHTAESSLDYEGAYTGTFPAADCPGIEMRLTLRPDGTYDLHAKYIDRDTEFDERGAYAVRGSLLTLTPSDGEQVAYYRVEENRLRRLDADKQPLTEALAEHYVLQKTEK